ncbi:UNVERIFIED_CONTAM: hypothetical protein Sindi_1271900 [Sesamum indicum]
MNVREEEEISLSSKDKPQEIGSPNDPMVIKMDIANFTVHIVLVDSGSSADTIFKNFLDKMELENAELEPVKSLLVGFGGSQVAPLGMLELPLSMGIEPRRRTLMVKFLVVDTPFAYNVILRRPGLNAFQAIVSTHHMKMKFPIENGVGEVLCDQKGARRCYNLSVKGGSEGKKRKAEGSSEPRLYEADRMKPSEEYKLIELVKGYRNRTTRIGSCMGGLETSMIELNVDPTVRLVRQKKRSFGMEKNQIIKQEAFGKWRMCTDFKDLNKACPKDPYPLPRIDMMVDFTVGGYLSAIGELDVPRSHTQNDGSLRRRYVGAEQEIEQSPRTS